MTDKTKMKNLQRILQLHKQGFKLKSIFSDIDGVLTDGGMYYTEEGDEIKQFSVYDGMGLKLMQREGVKVALITSEDRKLNKRRYKKLKLDGLIQGVWEKKKEAKKLCKEWGIKLSDCAFIGDEINDKELLESVGLAFCPANARDEIKNIPGIIVLESYGGEGVHREIYDMLYNYNLI